MVDVKREVTPGQEKVEPILDREFRELSVKLIKEYNYSPPLTFYKVDKKEELFMGLEIEVDKGGHDGEKAKVVYDIIGDNHCHIVHDGSLDDGFEIVTQPCTIEYHKTLLYEEMFKSLQSMGFKESPTTGLHVHINRNFFGSNNSEVDLNIAKILQLVNNHWEYIKIVARRQNSRYAKQFKDSSSFMRLYSSSLQEGKYCCVNLMHKNTIEFRMFAGTLSYFNLMATLEFIRNLAYVCKDTQLEKINDLSFKDIIQYKPTEYLELYCKNRKIQF